MSRWFALQCVWLFLSQAFAAAALVYWLCCLGIYSTHAMLQASMQGMSKLELDTSKRVKREGRHSHQSPHQFKQSNCCGMWDGEQSVAVHTSCQGPRRYKRWRPAAEVEGAAARPAA